jgi:hypothetical protein
MRFRGVFVEKRHLPSFGDEMTGSLVVQAAAASMSRLHNK